MSNKVDQHTPELLALTAERDHLRAEVNRLRGEVEELQRALATARQEVSDKAAITAERDLYLRELEEFWKEKMVDLDKNGVDLGKTILEIEEEYRARGLLDGD